MPQLDFSNPLTIAQVVWMAIIFGVLYYVLARYTLPQVAEVVDGRANRIAADLDGARAAKTQSDAAIAEVGGRSIGLSLIVGTAAQSATAMRLRTPIW